MNVRFDFGFRSLVRLLALAITVANVSVEVFAADPRIEYGRGKLEKAVTDAGYTTGSVQIDTRVDPDSTKLPVAARRAEGFSINTSLNSIEVTGFDSAGVLYGCLEVADRIRLEGEIPADWNESNAPAMTLRGPCLLLMKLGDYNFPVTPEEFPFFYDRAGWLQWLDRLAELRFNTFAMWNGHPFAYFVRFDRFTEAQGGIDAAQIEENRAQLHWLIREAERRNIRLVFQFYNIHTSVYFQRAHNLPEENRVPTPLLRDYNAYAIEAFAREFPEAGYYITPGEALELEHTDAWVNDVLIPAMRRGGARGPIWLRSWGIDLPHARKVAEANPDAWMERKFNVEMIADTRPDPENSEWAALDGRFVVNIHMAANLEPFRWTAPEYIRACVANSVAGGAGGLHLYPRKAWRWPDGSEPGLPLVQWERDWSWYLAWARYSWNPDRDPAAERVWWLDRLSRHFGSGAAAEDLLRSQEVAADVLPGLQRLLWLGDSNHTVVAAGARISELETAPGIPFLKLTDVAQRIPEFLADLKAGREPPHPTPVEFVNLKLEAATAAAALARKAASHAVRHRSEAAAWARDAAAIEQVVRFYVEKLEAVALRARAKAPGAVVDADAYLEPLARSLETYRSLAQRLGIAYDSLSDVPAWNPTRLKKVPYHWTDLVPLFERELNIHTLAISDPGPPPSREPILPGLVGLRYGDPGFKRLSGSDPITTLALDWTHDDRGRGWSAEWHGFIVPAHTGTLTLRVSSDNPATIEANHVRMLDGTGFPGVRTCAIPVEKDVAVPVQIGYDHPGGATAALEIQWSFDGSSFFPIPPEALKHSEENDRWADKAVLEVEL